MLCNLSQLDSGKLDTIKSAEQKLGKTLLAYNCYESKPDELSESELKELKNLENKLGVILVAVKK